MVIKHLRRPGGGQPGQAAYVHWPRQAPKGFSGFVERIHPVAT
jgi:hypothetical protein